MLPSAHSRTVATQRPSLLIVVVCFGIALILLAELLGITY